MDDIQLPEMELPKPQKLWRADVYDSGQMRTHREAYARAAVLADRERRATVTVQDERAAFEAWATSTRDQHGLPYFTVRDEDGKYLDGTTVHALNAWQARAALAPVADKLAEALRGVMANIAITGDYAKFEAARAALAEHDQKKGE